MISILTLFYISTFFITENHSAKILAINLIPSLSHIEFFRPIWKELSLRGHEVTVITPLPSRDQTLINITEIDVSCLFEVRESVDILKHYSNNNWVWNIQFFWKYLLENLVETMLSNAALKALLGSDEVFDLICVEAQHPVLYAFGERFKAPVVGK